MKDGTRIVGKFEEHKGRFVHLEGSPAIASSRIKSLTIFKQNK